MSNAANNLPWVPGNWRSGSDSTVSNAWNRPSPALPPSSNTRTNAREGGYNNIPLIHGNWRSGSDSNVSNTWNRQSPALPPSSNTRTNAREGGHTGSGYNNIPSIQGNWRSRNDSNIGTHSNNWNRHPEPPPPTRSLSIRPIESGSTQDPWRLFEDRVRTGPFGLSRFPSHPFSPLRVIVLDDEDNAMSREVDPRLRQFIQESPQRIRGQWQRQLAPEEEESKLTGEEQRKALKKLKKEVYNPYPKSTSKRNLYYRDNSSDRFSSENKDEDGKSCAICLEDFVPKQDVLVTPCKHMFHEECIIPWVKSNGQCPVCRFALGERRGERRRIFPLNNTPSNNNNANLATDLVEMDVIALIRAMEEAFQWVNVPH